MRVVLVVSLALCACAGSPSSEQVAKQPMIFQSPETGVLAAERPRSVALETPASPNVAATAVRLVYQQLDVPVKVDNPTTHQIGNASFYKTRTFAGKQMPELVNCGSSMTGPKAASYRIYMSLLTDVVPDGHGGTKLQTLFVSWAQDMSGGSTDPVPCSSTGKLELLINERIKNLIGK